MAESALRIIVEGRVQGVGFRFFTCDTARTLGLRGWVRNREDGTVEVAVVGDEERLKRFRAVVRTGPPSAHVTRLREEPLDHPPTGAGFEVIG